MTKNAHQRERRAALGRWCRHARLLPLAIAASCGTVYTRGRADPFGSWPLQAVVHDVQNIAAAFDPPPPSRERTAGSGFVAMQGFVSLPFDLVIDVVLVPVDVGGWLLGYTKAR